MPAENDPADAVESSDATPPKRKARVFTEETKQRFVSHWDWDYLPSDELDRMLANEDTPRDEPRG